MIQDLHSHTYYSFCGIDAPEAVVEKAIENGIKLLGISDHNYGIGVQRLETLSVDKRRRLKDYQRCLDAYLSHIRLLAEKYKNDIRVVAGVEIATINNPQMLLPEELSLEGVDYCLIEHISSDESVVEDVFEFAERCGCPVVGIAHTDIPGYLVKTKQDPIEFFRKMAKHNIFWEMNVNYDSIHGYKEHEYVRETLENQTLRDMLKACEVKLSVGFDSHKIELNKYFYHSNEMSHCFICVLKNESSLTSIHYLLYNLQE